MTKVVPALGVRFNATSSGTGDWVDASAVTGYRRAAANLTDGATYRYRAENPSLSEWEWGTGVWNNATSTLTRASVAFSSTGTSKIAFTAAPQVSIVIFPQDIVVPDDTTGALALLSSLTVAGTVALASTLSVVGAISSTAMGHQFGTAAGAVVGTALTRADANILLYNNSASSWAGIGADGNGAMFFRTGLTGSPAACFSLSNTGNASFTGTLSVGSDISGTNRLYLTDTLTSGGTQLSVKATRSGYSSSYKVVQLGDTATSNFVALGVDVSGVAGGNFNNNSIFLRNQVFLAQLNAAGTDWILNSVELNNGDLKVNSGTVANSTSSGALRVTGGASVTGSFYVGAAAIITGNASIGSFCNFGSSGNTYIGTELGSLGTGVNNKLFFSAGVGYRFGSLGAAGTMTVDSVGNVIISSDETLKIDKGNFTRGLEAVRQIRPKLYSWNEESGFETDGVYAGFFAQNVQKSIPEAVSRMANGKLAMQDRPMMATLFNAVNEMADRIETLERLAA